MSELIMTDLEDLDIPKALINEKVTYFENIIEQTTCLLASIADTAFNLEVLALNANIETTRASNFINSFESVISQNMLMQAKLVSFVFNSNLDNPKLDSIMEETLTQSGFEHVCITDQEGRIQYANQSRIIHQLLTNPGILKILMDSTVDVVLPKVMLSDGSFSKTVGVSRLDGKGIIQVTSEYIPPSGRLTINSFGVVAKEINKQAKEIEDIAEKIAIIFEQIKEQIQAAKRSDSNENLLQLQFSCKKVISLLDSILQMTKFTNLLAIRARIEAAQSTNDTGAFDELLNIHMVIQAKVCQNIFTQKELSYEQVGELASYCGIDEFWIANKKGIIDTTNIEGGKGFAFSNEGQTAPYMAILTNPKAIVTALPAHRALDGKILKYVGVSRKGGGIIQIGKFSAIYGDSTAAGFANVAEYVKQITEKARKTTDELQNIFQDMLPKIS
jgi:hypothetical protein